MDTYDFVIVGSGAGGSPLAANLAEAGYTVVVLEAGGAEAPDVYSVPAFHALASEDPDLSWQVFVDLYDDGARAKRNTKYVDGKGILYPRAGSLGGCTTHHAMITVYPHNSDWDGIAALTGDHSWNSAAMRSYFERLESCGYRDRPKVLPKNKWLARLLAAVPVVSDRFVNKGRHGFDGWLETHIADPRLVFPDKQLFDAVKEAAESSLSNFLDRRLNVWELLDGYTDPNDWQVAKSPAGMEGLWRIPISTSTNGKRNAARERLLAVERAHPDRLHVRTDALVCRVLLDEHGTAYGVEYVDTARAYRASHAPHDGELGPRQTVRARHEVILSAGAFNTPQLLMLSGIGPRDHLAEHGIECRADLPGVGRNLQDRYEVGVVSEADADFALLENAAFRPPRDGDPPDPQWEKWQQGKGIYSTNGALIAVVHRSRPELPDPDLFLFGLPADFRGYVPGYSESLEQSRNRFTWAILKAHTGNTAGSVRLRSGDPRDTPAVSFRYFDEGSDDGTPGSQADADRDLDDVVTGVELVRRLNRKAGDVFARELVPGPEVSTREQLRTWVADEAWGHHASCTARIGAADDRMAVVDSEFAVHGVPGLRVVDASVFPRIPGFFIVTPVYMVSEKASDVIIAAARARSGERGGLQRLRHRLGRQQRGRQA